MHNNNLPDTSLLSSSFISYSFFHFNYGSPISSFYSRVFFISVLSHQLHMLVIALYIYISYIMLLVQQLIPKGYTVEKKQRNIGLLHFESRIGRKEM